MKRSVSPNRFFLGTALLAAALLIGSCGRGRVSEGVPRHVVVISIDTARADAFGFMGAADAATPRLDELAARSVVLTDYMTVVPTTLASHTTLFTGKYPHHHGTPRNGFMVNRANVMLAEVLKEAGFHTAGFAGSFALDRRFDFAQGFDHYDQEFDILVGDDGADQNQRRASEVTDAALRYLDQRGTPERLFLFVHYFDPHAPYDAPPPYDGLYDPRGREGLIPVSDLIQLRSRDPERAAREAERHAMQYASEISYTDEHLGRLLDGLAARGILDEALVVVTSDHGESMWEHDEEFDHGRCVYQSTMHCLCVFRLPAGAGGGRRTDWPAQSTDVMPTILSMLGLDVPDGVDGEVIPLTEDRDHGTDRARFGQATKPWRGVETDITWHNMLKARCVRSGSYKFIETPYLGTRELYDLSTDPDERGDLSATGSPGQRAIADRLEPLVQSWARSADPLESWFDDSQREETIRRLRSLGYLN